jgi:hypothetical protein
MFGKRAVLAGLAGTALVVSTVAVAYADAGSGFSTLLIGRGQSAHSFGIQQRKGNDVVTVENTETPGGSSGWHSHPGTAVIVVQSGSFTLSTASRSAGARVACTSTAPGRFTLSNPKTSRTASTLAP